MIIALQLVLLILIAGSVAFYIWCAVSTAEFFLAPKQEEDINYQPVSIMIPVCGVDDHSRENWESFCQQDYEDYEVLFGVMNPKDPAVPILEEVVAKFPGRAKLIFCLEVLGLNHQVSNLMHLLEAAQHELVIFTDSDVYVKTHYLRTVTAPLVDSSIGLVTCSYVAHKPHFLVPAIAALGRCLDNIPSVLLARKLNGGGLWFAFGATMATRKSLLTQVGGLQSIVNRIGSDYLIGNMVVNAGYRIELSRYIIETDGGRQTFQQLFQRELRWAITIRYTEGLLYYGNVFIYGTVYCVPLLLLSGFQLWAVIVSIVTIVIRIVQSLTAIYTMNCPKLATWLWALPLRDLLSFIIFVGGGVSKSIYWRGRRLQIGMGGTLTEQDSIRV
ncbi:glycosyltransferase [Aetokthonos hydrillicola Thurmond2011]|jgi:ceramide glucosyltransferase|uniref:Glycosyltransferase n=1 Tax=Aetokthonos hydrillicola Thurmond2011 TaxID=2712845 RepID=A0AAP5I6X4_9CYAN|nr:glycosyltransferase [Aetokthonos hydrillicola]MBO3461872.1 glycosyltransferase [Aetokthonos hydrillicola CCALA 1050]MBW4586786.1 glycosyltransferase [Aetokthonos hydrillicola CCALA 1050]MDR9895855.1 glycosyltransferase [Aetokthonos hydrillicola Thurmond2011]